MAMLEDDEVVVRPEIMAFAVEMERVMAVHDGDYGDSYKRMTTEDFIFALLTIHKRASNIFNELGPFAENAESIERLAARIGCYAMFFHHGYRNHCQVSEEKDDAPD